MPRGQPDYSNPSYGQGQSYIDPGLMTLAAAGLVSVDNRGRPILLETWGEGAGGWFKYDNSGTGAAIVTTAQSYVAPVSLQITPPGEDDSSYTQMFKMARWPRTGKFGLEWVHMAQTGRTYFETALYFFDGLTYQNGAVRVDTDTKNVYIETPSGWQLIASAVASIFDPVWLPVKMVCNPTTGYYESLIIADQRYDLREYLLANGASAFQSSLMVSFKSIWKATAPTAGDYVGYMLVTSDEP